MDEPKIPSEVEAEIALLGCAFLDSGVFETIYGYLKADDFYDAKNRMIFHSMMELYNGRISIDITTVISNLSSHNLLEQAGGYEYISLIATRGYSTDNVDSYVELVINASLRRKAISSLADLSSKGYDTKLDTPAYLDLVERQVFDLSKNRTTTELVHIKNVTENVLTDIEKKSSIDQDVVGVNTGFQKLNEITQGFQKDQLIILAARPAMGKSAFALNLATNIASLNKNGKASVAIFSLEMSSEMLVERVLACESKVELGSIRKGKIGKENWNRFNAACSKLSFLNMYFDDSADLTISKIRSKCRKLQENIGLDFVVIDYLQLIEEAGSSQIEKITKITRSLKLMARDLHVPVLALSQLSRKVEERKDGDRKPILADLRDSGSIEQDADIVMFIYRDEYYRPKQTTRPGEADIIIAKNRSGSLGEMVCRVKLEYQEFREQFSQPEKE